MNTKLTLASIVVSIFLLGTACSPEISSQPILDQAQPEEESYETALLVPVTGVNAIENASAFGQDALAYPNQKSHSNCVSQDSHRQNMCGEKEPNAVIRHSDNVQAEPQEYPSQKLHSHCVSEDVDRQNKCMD
jgi:hypothetical protein